MVLWPFVWFAGCLYFLGEQSLRRFELYHAFCEGCYGSPLIKKLIRTEKHFYVHNLFTCLSLNVLACDGNKSNSFHEECLCESSGKCFETPCTRLVGVTGFETQSREEHSRIPLPLLQAPFLNKCPANIVILNIWLGWLA